MLNTKSQQIVYAAVEFLKAEGFTDIKANIAGYDKPSEIVSKESKKSYIPNLTAKDKNSAYIFEIELEEDYQIEKWKEFASSNGEFLIITEEQKEGHIDNTLKENKIKADIICFI